MNKNSSQIDLGKLGQQRLNNFCRAIKKLVKGKKIHFDFIIAAGNSGICMAKYTEFIYDELGLKYPFQMSVPFYRYLPGYRDNPDKLFESNIFLPEIVKQLKNVKSDIKDVLFVDDEIGQGITAIAIFKLINQALRQLKMSQINHYYIVAEDQGFKIPKGCTQIKFVPYDLELAGYYNCIFLTTPSSLEKPISKILGGDDVFPFHWRVNLLLDIPIKDFNEGRPIYTYKYHKLVEEKILNFQLLQKDYLVFIKKMIKECLNKYS